MMQRIVVAYDGSEPARRALERAVDLAGPDTTVTVVNAITPQEVANVPHLPGEKIWIEEREPIRQAHDELLQEARNILASQNVHTTIVEPVDTPAKAILAEVERLQPDLVIVGSRGLNAAKRVLLGSVSTAVVHHAPCDVLVVR